MSSPIDHPVAAKFLERALLFTIVIHAVAMVSMVVFLLPGMPGGPNADSPGDFRIDSALPSSHDPTFVKAGLRNRVAYIAEHPWRWRIGWIPWQLTAFSDLLIAIALLRTPWIPRIPSLIVLILTLVAIAIEQPGEIRWMTEGVDLAQNAHFRSGPLLREFDAYRLFEKSNFHQVGLVAALFYTLAAIAWTWCFVAARLWNHFFVILSVVTWTLMLGLTGLPLLSDGELSSTAISDISAGNAIGFVLMMIWFIWITERILRRSRRADLHGRMTPWRSPYWKPFGPLFDFIANSRLIRAYGELLPTPAFVSDITDVIYVNYLVDASRLEPLVPPYLELQRLGPGGKYALFTHLTYNHGHFGPRFLGPLRRLLPSPLQSNWRIHVRDPQTGVLGIYFVTTVTTNPLNALAARHLSEGVSMHIPKSAEVTRRPDGSFLLRIDPGNGTAPDLYAELKLSSAPELGPQWNECFASFQAMLEYCVPQDRALSSQSWYRRVTRQEIRLDIPFEVCEPLAGEVQSKAADVIAGDAKPLCFRVPKVNFRYDGEEYDVRKSV